MMNYDANGKKLLDEEKTAYLDKMIRGIAWSKRNTIMMDFEDVVSELWINALEIIEKRQEVNFDYIFKACKYKIVDLVRKNIRTAYLPYDNSEFERCIPIELRNECGNDGNSNQEFHSYNYSTSKPISAEGYTEVMSMLDLFTEGTKEFKLVKSWMEILGIIEAEDLQKLPDSAYDRYIAVDILGYASSSSNGYAKLRNKVRDKLIKSGYKMA